MKQFKCLLVTEGWMTDCIDRQEYIFAVDEAHAREIICKQWKIRKNKKGLRIKEVPFVTAEKISHTKTELISETSYAYWLGYYDSSYYGKVTRYYCGKCNKEVRSTDRLCTYCGAHFTN